MKAFYSLLIISITLCSCASSSKYLSRGQYDAATRQAVIKLRKNPGKAKEVTNLEKAYFLANQQDRDRIEFLKKEGRPEAWNEIFALYSNLNSRQSLVKTIVPQVIPSTKKRFDPPMINYDQEIISAKQKAAEYFYSHGVKLMEKQEKQSYREAYNDFLRVKQYYIDYKDVEDQLKKAHALGTSYVIFKMENKTGIPLPPDFEGELKKISLAELNRQWISYDVNENKNMKYDYTVLVNMKTIAVSPEGIKEVNYEETKEVPDGFQYVLDSKGNVKKDSLGNDIKVPKFKIIRAHVKEIHKHKQAMISGTLDYIDNKTGQLIKTAPVGTETAFDNVSALAIGDLEALKPETKKKLNSPPMPFPNDFAMLMQAGGNLKGLVKDILYGNKELLR